jgi:hypothetical protein
VVDHDAIEPGPEAAAPFERRQCGEGFDQDLLGGILRVLGVVEHPDGDVVDPGLMTIHQSFERLAIA